ncbi:MAG: rhombosortase [Gammaproteobacteria bacterium]|nr:rhombosortase [Gammaproteobacteria bacterium]
MKINLPTLTVLTLIVFLLLGQVFSQIFQYERASILNGEYWRIVTGHFTHTGWNHLFLNVLGLVLVFGTFYRVYSPVCWLLGSAFCLVGVSACFMLFSPSLEWYRGLSGLLHCFLVMGVIGEIRRGKWLYGFGFLAVMGKVFVEFSVGHSGRITGFINADIINDAHLYGAISGGIMACVLIFIKEILPNRMYGNTG